jgi:hypothetical protein
MFFDVAPISLCHKFSLALTRGRHRHGVASKAKLQRYAATNSSSTRGRGAACAGVTQPPSQHEAIGGNALAGVVMKAPPAPALLEVLIVGLAQRIAQVVPVGCSHPHADDRTVP